MPRHTPYCPMCVEGERVLLGTLGRANCYRCRACGWTWTATRKPARARSQPAKPAA